MSKKNTQNNVATETETQNANTAAETENVNVSELDQLATLCSEYTTLCNTMKKDQVTTKQRIFQYALRITRLSVKLHIRGQKNVLEKCSGTIGSKLYTLLVAPYCIRPESITCDNGITTYRYGKKPESYMPREEIFAAIPRSLYESFSSVAKFNRCFVFPSEKKKTWKDRVRNILNAESDIDPQLKLAIFELLA